MKAFALAILFAGPAAAQDMPGMVMPPAAPAAPSAAMAPAASPAAAAPAHDHAAAGHGPAPAIGDAMAGHGMAGMDMGGAHAPALRGAFGPYAATREASGTSWQPDTSTHDGLHATAGAWSLMLHGFLNGVYTAQSGPRGADKVFVAGHLMGMAARDVSDRDRVQLRAALSPDPFMGPRGYPLLLASGETADGVNQLVDRQHPHDLFSELSVSLSHRLSDTASVFVYAGLPGEPAFGPPAYLHRQAIVADPEAPISHHWLDSTHVSMGVVTAGVVVGRAKAEVSRFRGREPDQHRYDIETPSLDSTAVRVGWNPTPELSLQASFAHQISPEQLSPDADLDRWSASAIYTRRLGADGFWATTVTWGRRIVLDHGTRDAPLDAFVVETTVHPDRRWTVFGRAERVDNNELVGGAGGGHGPAFTVGRVSLGAIRDFRLTPGVVFGVGGLVSRSLTPAGLDPAYGGDRTSGTGFVRLKLG